MELIIAIVAGLIIGALVGAYFMWLRSKGDGLSEHELAASQQKVTELTLQKEEVQLKVDELIGDKQELQTDLAVLKEKYGTAVTSLDEKEAQLNVFKDSSERQRSLNEKALADSSRVLAELKASQESLQQTRYTHSELLKKHDNLISSEGLLKKSLATAEEKIIAFDKIETEIKALRSENNVLTAIRSELQTRLEEQAEQTQQKLQLLEESKGQLKEQFKNLAQEIFEEKSTKFTEFNKEKLENLINPFKEQIKGFTERLHANHENDFRDRTELKKEIENLNKLNTTMSAEANNLTRALKGDAKTQGNWGEVILERILEEAGLRQGVEYEREVSTNDAEGNRFRPDVIIRLPEKKDVIIDSKVSLVAYEKYISAVDDVERELALRDHLASVKSHIHSLSQKNYESLPEFNNLDYVLLFMPIEGAFRAAAEADSNLIFEASKKNIMLISPSTLMISLRTVHSLWQYEYQNQNARDIAERAGALCDKFANFVADVEDIGKHIDKLQTSFGRARGKLSTGSGNLIRQCEMLKGLGVKPKKQIPEQILRESRADTIGG
ncbi:DNA recombination protein RmuC [Akkermansiaceae bacterium]|nr:DNA recombination protein RmuC [Akkermansiaceae bacterium]